jgi:hypothetical protein
VGGLSENIDNFVDGIKVPVRADSIAWGINYIIEDPMRMRAMGLAGKRKVISLFNWETIRMKMEQVYENLLHAREGEEPGCLPGGINADQKEETSDRIHGRRKFTSFFRI